jgi:hypothetical protein
MATTYLDYQGRTVDVLALRGQRPSGDTLLSMSLTDEESGGEVCTGATAVAQAFVLQFMREQGSAPYNDDGCPFMTAARQGRILTETDVFQLFNLSAALVQRNMVNRELATDPDDERFSDAKLDAVTIVPGAVTMHITVTTKAGTSRKVIMPMPLVV